MWYPLLPNHDICSSHVGLSGIQSPPGDADGLHTYAPWEWVQEPRRTAPFNSQGPYGVVEQYMVISLLTALWKLLKGLPFFSHVLRDVPKNTQWQWGYYPANCIGDKSSNDCDGARHCSSCFLYVNILYP